MSSGIIRKILTQKYKCLTQKFHILTQKNAANNNEIYTWRIICKNCNRNMVDYVYKNPVSTDLKMRFCPVCDKEELDGSSWEIDENPDEY